MRNQPTPAHLKRERAAKEWLVDQIRVYYGYASDDELLAMYRKEFPNTLTDAEVLAGIKYLRWSYQRREPRPTCPHCGQVRP